MEKEGSNSQGKRITHLPTSRSLKPRRSTEDGGSDSLSKCGGVDVGKVEK